MFDFDKQNRKGAPKGFGIKRIVGGLADNMTMGLTDFDQRGAGLMQFDPIGGGKDKAWGKEAPLNARKKNFKNLVSPSTGMSGYNYSIDQPRVNNRAEMEEYYKNNPESRGGEWVTDGDQWVLLTPKQSKDRKDELVKKALSGNKEAEGFLDFEDPSWRENLTKDNLKGSSNLKLGKQPVKFDQELLGVSASYETDGGQKEFIVYAPTTEINILPVDTSDQLVTSRSTTSSGDDPYGILEKGN